MALLAFYVAGRIYVDHFTAPRMALLAFCVASRYRTPMTFHVGSFRITPSKSINPASVADPILDPQFLCMPKTMIRYLVKLKRIDRVDKVATN